MSINNFQKDTVVRLQSNSKNSKLKKLANSFLKESVKSKYTYNFNWLGVPIIQLPQDIIATQEIIWNVQPDLIIETGIAHGGSLILSASLLANLNYINPIKTKRLVVGVDIDIRRNNKNIIKNHPLSRFIKMVEGSSIDEVIFDKVKKISSKFKKILVILDSNHTGDHVYNELNFYSQLVSKNSYCIVCDTLIEDMPKDFYPDRSWGKGNNPKTAIKNFLKVNKKFKIDQMVDNKILISMSKNGYLKKIK